GGAADAEQDHAEHARDDDGEVGGGGVPEVILKPGAGEDEPEGEEQADADEAAVDEAALDGGGVPAVVGHAQQGEAVERDRGGEADADDEGGGSRGQPAGRGHGAGRGLESGGHDLVREAAGVLDPVGDAPHERPGAGGAETAEDGGDGDVQVGGGGPQPGDDCGREHGAPHGGGRDPRREEARAAG